MAQFGSALDWGSSGRRFKSCQPDQGQSLERQREGIALAKAAGKYKGRKPSLSPGRVNELRKRLTNGESVTALASEYGVSRQTVYNYKIA